MRSLKITSNWSFIFVIGLTSSAAWAQSLGPMPGFRYAVDLPEFRHPQNRELSQVFRGCVEVAREGRSACEAASGQAQMIAMGAVQQAGGAAGSGPSMGAGAVAMAGASARGASAIEPAINVCVQAQEACARVCGEAADHLDQGVQWVEGRLGMAHQDPTVAEERPLLENDYNVGYPAKTNARLLVSECSRRFAERVALLEATRASAAQAAQQAATVGVAVGEHDAETADLIARLRPRQSGNQQVPPPQPQRPTTAPATRAARPSASVPQQGFRSDEEAMRAVRNLAIQGSGPRCARTRGATNGCGANR